VNELAVVGKLAELQARLEAVERLSGKTEERVGGIEKVMWGWGGAIGLLGFVVGIFSDWIKDRLLGS
jgi:hypothetical protein